ncbi:hypothetical protein BDY21DRAFT_422202 [Lineolata rhizophorae]|uniref:Uncharacterized protein n=1 Tax=Lineolata rhizophorae TaxID=578093 RepID=A0A6A6NX89_9PEZI|nr:hypothetical protein BDY21DRAFT_422202 [Lineolata rhizophorae]
MATTASSEGARKRRRDKVAWKYLGSDSPEIQNTTRDGPTLQEECLINLSQAVMEIDYIVIHYSTHIIEENITKEDPGIPKAWLHQKLETSLSELSDILVETASEGLLGPEIRLTIRERWEALYMVGDTSPNPIRFASHHTKQRNNSSEFSEHPTQQIPD